MTTKQPKYSRFVKQKDCHEEKDIFFSKKIDSEPIGTKLGNVVQDLNNKLSDTKTKGLHNQTRFSVQNKSRPAAEGHYLSHQKTRVGSSTEKSLFTTGKYSGDESDSPDEESQNSGLDHAGEVTERPNTKKRQRPFRNHGWAALRWRNSAMARTPLSYWPLRYKIIQNETSE